MPYSGEERGKTASRCTPNLHPYQVIASFPSQHAVKLKSANVAPLQCTSRTGRLFCICLSITPTLFKLLLGLEQAVLSRYRQPPTPKVSKCDDAPQNKAQEGATQDDTSPGPPAHWTVPSSTVAPAQPAARSAANAPGLPHGPAPVDLASALQKALRACTELGSDSSHHPHGTPAHMVRLHPCPTPP